MLFPNEGIARPRIPEKSLKHDLLRSCLIRVLSLVYDMFKRDPRAGVFLGGDRVSGQDIRDQNGAFSANGHGGKVAEEALIAQCSPRKRSRTW